MGLDIEYQAMPEDCALLQRARREPAFGSYLEFFQRYATPASGPLLRHTDDEVLTSFIAEAKQVVSNHPGIETRNFHGDRRWDKIHYLLSKKRRLRESRDETDWAERAILGGSLLHPQTQTTIGAPIRFLTADEVHSISQQLQSISAESLREHWNVAAMIEAGVYKMHPEDDDDDWEWTKRSYQELVEFYALVARYGEGVLTWLG